MLVRKVTPGISLRDWHMTGRAGGQMFMVYAPCGQIDLSKYFSNTTETRLCRMKNIHFSVKNGKKKKQIKQSIQ